MAPRPAGWFRRGPPGVRENSLAGAPVYSDPASPADRRIDLAAPSRNRHRKSSEDRTRSITSSGMAQCSGRQPGQESSAEPSPLDLTGHHRDHARYVEAVAEARLREVDYHVRPVEHGLRYAESLVAEHECVGGEESRIEHGNAACGPLDGDYPPARGGCPFRRVLRPFETHPGYGVLSPPRGVREFPVARHGADAAEEHGGWVDGLRRPERRTHVEGASEAVEYEYRRIAWRMQPRGGEG